MRKIRFLAYAVAASALAPQRVHRRRQLLGGALATCSTALAPTLANALVKGSAPPPKASRGEKRTCKTIDECEEVGRQRAAAAFDAQNDQPFFTTKDGVRWRDVREGSGGEVLKGDGVLLKYRVMRLGKRATDNLSGEASPVFSLGYGEDDDTEKDVLQAVVGAKQLIPALDSALVGMRKGGSRRLFVVPEKGWKKINASCSAATNGASNAGDASAGGLDVLGQAVVPLAEIVDNDACIEDVLLPQPRNFGAKRRLARRFDEGLLVEVEVVDLRKGG